MFGFFKKGGNKSYQPSNLFTHLGRGCMSAEGKDGPGSMALEVGVPDWGASTHVKPALSSWMEREPFWRSAPAPCSSEEAWGAHPSPHSQPSLPRERHSLARFIQQPPGGALTAHKNVLLQGLLMKHPVAHAEGRVTCRKAQDQCGPRLVEVQQRLHDISVVYYPVGTVNISLYSSSTNSENYILETLDIFTQVARHVPSPEPWRESKNGSSVPRSFDLKCTQLPWVTILNHISGTTGLAV